MEILSGDLEYRLADDGPWTWVKGGDSFMVPADSAFTMRVLLLTDYCCSFLP
jgi:uncharacterized protein YaiE (UPF0345 family)